MENASQALIMACGILIGVLILSLMVTLFLSGNEYFKSYEDTKQSEAVQQFNTNFTKYIGQDLTIYQVITICNFAKENNIQTVKVSSGGKTVDNIKDDLTTYTDIEQKLYKLSIISYTEEGYINEISFS